MITKTTTCDLEEIYEGDRALCPTCGELEVINGKVSHPEQDTILAKILEDGCAIHYINEGNSQHSY